MEMYSFKPIDRGKIPAGPGVYLFYDADGTLLYVGKSVNLKQRVASHFRSPTLNNRQIDIRHLVDRIEVIPTATELAALLIELHLIKTKFPMYNRRSRRIRRLYILVADYESRVCLKVVSVNADSDTARGDWHGVFKTRRQAREWLLEKARDYKLCPIRLGIESGNGECFSSQLGQCAGVCAGRESFDQHDGRLQKILANRSIKVWPYQSEIILSQADNGVSEELVIKDWCLKSATISGADLTTTFSGAELISFDYDMYKVLAPTIFSGISTTCK